MLSKHHKPIDSLGRPREATRMQLQLNCWRGWVWGGLLLIALSGSVWAENAHEVGDFTRAARKLFLAGDFAGLEKQAKELRETRAHFSDGRWKLPLFYQAMGPYARSEEDWGAYFDRLVDWKKAVPDSITEPVVQAEALTAYAWAARGSGYADTVSQEGWAKMADRLKEARENLEAARKLPAVCPEWYRAMMTVALGQGWTPENYEHLFQAAVAAEPLGYDFYFQKAYWLLPRWYGKKGEWEAFAEEAARKYDAPEGLALYARIAWANAGFYQNLFKETAIDWPTMRQGFQDMEKQYPNSDWNLNAFFRFAVMAEDRATARTLLDRLGDRADPRQWSDAEKLEAAKQWVRAE